MSLSLLPAVMDADSDGSVAVVPVDQVGTVRDLRPTIKAWRAVRSRGQDRAQRRTASSCGLDGGEHCAMIQTMVGRMGQLREVRGVGARRRGRRGVNEANTRSLTDAPLRQRPSASV